jgi:thiol-disulfide isomerase/thioredoxin
LEKKMSLRWYHFGLVTFLVCPASSLFSGELKETFIEKGITAKTGGFRPERAPMEEASDLIKKEPEGLTNKKYGAIKINDLSWAFLLDEPEEGDAKLYLDTNQDGDLTNDPGTEWTAKAVGKYTQYNGSGQIQLPNGKLGTVMMYRFDPTEERRAPLKNTLLFYSDFGYEFEFQLDGESLKTFVAGTVSDSTPLPIDRDGNGRISSRFEVAKVGEPFNFTGTTYRFLANEGKLSLKEETDAIAQLPPPPDLRLGKTAISFTAKAMDGTDVEFPKSYAGKIVMLDFWATWCGPCIGEVPNMKQAYEDWHDKGFEILGVSLDDEKDEEKLKEFVTEKKLPWAQIYDGKGWDAEQAIRYDVSGIPFVLLVDGDSGKILGTSRELRGKGLSEYVGKQLEEKSKPSESTSN